MMHLAGKFVERRSESRASSTDRRVSAISGPETTNELLFGLEAANSDVEMASVFASADNTVTGMNVSKVIQSVDLSNAPSGCTSVDVFFYVNSVSHVDMSSMNAQVDVGVCLNWKDPRMAGFSTTDKIPSNLWAPSVGLWNCEGDASIEHKDFYVADSATGGLARTTRYIAIVSFSIDATFDLFPFDLIAIPMRMTNGGVGILADGVTKTYTATDSLVFIIHPSLTPQAPLYQFWTFGGDLTEWKLEGCSFSCEDETEKKTVEKLQLNFHYARRPEYYMWKIVLPIVILTLVSFGVFVFPIGDIVNRYNYLLTVLLSSFALLFVIGADIPRSQMLMSVDRAILTSLCATLSSGLLSLYSFNHLSQKVNDYGGSVIVVITFIYMAILFIRPYYYSIGAKKKLMNLQNFQDLPTILRLKNAIM